MRVTFTIAGEAPEPTLGIVRAEIAEAVNELARIDLVVARRERLTLEEMEQLVEEPVSLALSDRVGDREKTSRWDGKIYEIEERLDPAERVLNLYSYRLAIRPALWDLEFNVTYRCFNDRTRPEIISEVLGRNHLAQGRDFECKYFEQEFTRYAQIEQNWVADLDFVVEMMRPEGICLAYAFDDTGSEPPRATFVDHAMFLRHKLDEPLQLIAESGMRAAGQRVTSLKTVVHSVSKTIRSSRQNARSQAVKAAGTIDLPHESAYGAKQLERQVKLLDRAQEARRVERRGESNAFTLHPGTNLEVFTGAKGRLPEKMRIQAVRHLASQQGAPSLDPESRLEYKNEFRAVPADAPVAWGFDWTVGAGEP